MTLDFKEYLKEKQILLSYIRTFVPEEYEVEIEDSNYAVIITILNTDISENSGTFIRFQSWDENRKHEFLKADFDSFMEKLNV